MPEVSVCIPHRNEPYLDEAVASIEAQGVDVELVVVEDVSGAGAGATRNMCLAQASCDLIFRMDADDVLPPDTLRPMLRRAARSLIVCTAEVWFFRDDTPRDGSNRWTWTDLHPYTILTSAHSPASTGNVLYHRSLHDRLGPCPEDCGGFEGWALFARAMVEGFDFVTAADTHYLHRLHDDSYWCERTLQQRDDLAAALMYVYADRMLG